MGLGSSERKLLNAPILLPPTHALAREFREWGRRRHLSLFRMCSVFRNVTTRAGTTYHLTQIGLRTPAAQNSPAKRRVCGGLRLVEASKSQLFVLSLSFKISNMANPNHISQQTMSLDCAK
jgi:hypothetical protein